jgi:hypothetical protein
MKVPGSSRRSQAIRGNSPWNRSVSSCSSVSSVSLVAVAIAIAIVWMSWSFRWMSRRPSPSRTLCRTEAMMVNGDVSKILFSYLCAALLTVVPRSLLLCRALVSPRGEFINCNAVLNLRSFLCRDYCFGGGVVCCGLKFD